MGIEMTVPHEIVLGVVLGKSNHEKDTIPDLQRAHKSVKRDQYCLLSQS